MNEKSTIFDEDQAIEISLTKRCAQYRWGALYYFPCCPKEIGINPLKHYCYNLSKGKVFAYNDDSPSLIVVDFIMANNNTSVLVMCEREGFRAEQEGYKPWLITEITFENGLFIHSKVGSWFEKDDADRTFGYSMQTFVYGQLPSKNL